MNEMLKMFLVTTVICIFSATLLSGLKSGLQDKIETQEDLYIRGPAIEKLLSGSPNNPLEDRVTMIVNGLQVNIYPWVDDEGVRLIALEQAGSGGYGGDVIVMTAVDMKSGAIHGVEVTQHKETPGVGTRAMQPGFLSKFIAISIEKDIALKANGGEIDAVSGATRSSTAITDAVNAAINLVETRREEIIAAVTESDKV